ncbi:MAG: FKBP-type peptidyl-prolyl cis-trans isomerase N-terminal domain-containing protein [Bacteroidales bacterium]|nr:FKBP-type peptidyl-prolyl cis-trans isomerase N-terminal domain-containing protein [Bacteroidales bacterium]MEE1225954.1 FKBP-type peptidyl-prolyl cis-trans isomerase N-terminal domain-containing protein [Bacteroidales bacterium]
MKRLFCLTSVMLFTLITFVACSQKEVKVSASSLKNVTDSASYIMGYTQAMQMKVQGVEINPEVFATAIQQVLSGDTTSLLTQEQMQKTMQSYQEMMMQKQMAELNKIAEPNRKVAEAFLAKNKEKKDVVTTTSGLQYRIEKAGKGIKPANVDDRVRFNYSLTALNIDGTFSSPIENTFEREGDPTISVLNGLIPGIVEGFCLMNQGSIYEFWIHPDLAYGNQNSEEIPAGSLLHFRIELVEVLPSK